MNLIKPKILQKGDTIGLLTACSPLDDAQRQSLDKAKEYFTKKGFKVVISKTSNGENPSDDEKVNAIHAFFKNPDINVIIAARGGYGAIRLLNNLDYDLIRKNPKIFAGFSDVTAFQWFIYTKSGLVTFHAPMCCCDFGSNIDTTTEESFFQTVSGQTSQIKLTPAFTFNTTGKIKGILAPSNLATAASLCGREFYPNKDIILLIEDVNEPEYKINRMVTQILETKDFAKHIKAIVLGKFTDENDQEAIYTEMWKEFSEKYRLPICDGAQFGHIKTKVTIPFGVDAVLDFEAQKIDFELPVI